MHIYSESVKQRNLYIGFGFFNARFTRYRYKKININEIQEGNM